jgi:hypothetical protein
MCVAVLFRFGDVVMVATDTRHYLRPGENSLGLPQFLDIGGKLVSSGGGWAAVTGEGGPGAVVLAALSESVDARSVRATIEAALLDGGFATRGDWETHDGRAHGVNTLVALPEGQAVRLFVAKNAEVREAQAFAISLPSAIPADEQEEWAVLLRSQLDSAECVDDCLRVLGRFLVALARRTAQVSTVLEVGIVRADVGEKRTAFLRGDAAAIAACSGNGLADAFAAAAPSAGVQVPTRSLFNADADTPLIDTTTRQMQTALAPSRAAQFWQDGKYALQADTNDGTTTVSTAFETQGSVVPLSVADSPFSANMGGPSSGQMWATWTWSGFSLYRPGSGALAVAACTTMFAQPSAPTCTTVAGGGPAGARNYYVRVGYMKDGKVYRVSAEQASAPTAVGATNRLKVTSPGAVAGYDGWCVLIGTATNTEVFQSDVPATALIAFGTDYTEPAGGAITTGKTPYNSAMLNGITEIGLNASPTVYYWYPYYKLSDSLIYLYSGGSSDTALAALEAVKDGRIPLAWRVTGSSLKTSIQAAMPAATLTGTSTGGGRF